MENLLIGKLAPTIRTQEGKETSTLESFMNHNKEIVPFKAISPLAIKLRTRELYEFVVILLG